MKSLELRNTETQFIEEKLNSEKDMAKVSLCMTKEEYMKEIGCRTREKVKVLRYLQIKTLIRGNSKTISLMVKEYSLGLMEKFMMENGRMELNRAMEYGKASMEIHT